MAGVPGRRGDIVFTLDGDLQDDPAEIPRFLAELEEGLRRRQRLEEDAPRPLAQGLSQPRLQLDGQRADRLPPARPQLRLQALSPRRAARRSASMASCTGSFRSWRMPAASASARSRSTIGRAGTASSKYGFSRFLKGFLDLLTVRFLTRFSQRPLHVLGGIGLVLFGAGRPGHALSGRLLARSEATGRSATARCSSTRSRSSIVGVQLVSLGILAELVTAYNIRPRTRTASPRRFPAKTEKTRPRSTAPPRTRR